MLLVILETYVPTILYQFHDSLLAGDQGVTRMYVTLKEKFYANNLFNSIEGMYKVVIHVKQDLLKNQVISPISRHKVDTFIQSRFQLYFVCYMQDLKL